jgi:succinylglutamate desuccinylase
MFAATACTSVEQGRRDFERDLARCVGQRLEGSKPACDVSAPREIVALDESHDEYRYSYHDCRWEYTVNRFTRVVESYRFLSAPEACYYRAFDPPL